MEHLSLEIFDLSGTGSKYAVLPEDATISITDTSEIFASGDVWSHSFQLNVNANAHIFGSAGEIHGSRLHDVLNKRRARLWVEGLPLYLGYLMLDGETEVGADGNVDVRFESGQKTFEDMIDGTNAQEVSVGDVVIGVALNRKRVIKTVNPSFQFTLDGLDGYSVKDGRLKAVANNKYIINTSEPDPRGSQYDNKYTPYAQRWPKLVKSHGKVWDSNGTEQDIDKTNIQTPYDETPEHSFCNINICYPLKVNDNGEEKQVRGYTMRLAHGNPTTHGGDNQTRYNNAPNFYLLYWLDRLFADMKIHVKENQAKDVEDLRRVFMLNYGCHYEEIEDFDSIEHKTPTDKLSRYGQYYIPFLDNNGEKYITTDAGNAGWRMDPENNTGSRSAGKVLLRDVNVSINGTSVLQVGSIEGKVLYSWFRVQDAFGVHEGDYRPEISLYYNTPEMNHGGYSSYLAYATSENYPNVDISEVINAMKSMFGVRLIFDNDYKTVRIVLLRNIFRNTDVQEISCEITDEDEKTESNIRGFRMTYGKGKEDTNYYYKGFNDMFLRADTIWKDTTDKHDYSQWKLDADYNEIKQSVSAMNKTCYVTPVNGNAYGVKVDEDEDVLFPALNGYAGFIDAEDGDCSHIDSEEGTVEEVQTGASPVIMNDVNGVYASLFGGDMSAPTPVITDDTYPVQDNPNSFYNVSTKVGTFARITNEQSLDFSGSGSGTVNDTEFTFAVSGKLDIYSCEGFKIRMEDNYSVSNGGTPFDEASPGLCFGIMRGSGADAYIHYYDDPDEDEDNDAWDVEPGSGAISHPDTCDSYGNIWDYDGTGSAVVKDSEDAIEYLQSLWPDSNIDLIHSSGSTMRDESNCIYVASIQTVPDDNGDLVNLLFATDNYMPKAQFAALANTYARNFNGMTAAQMYTYDGSHNRWLVEVGSSDGRMQTLLALEWAAFVYINPNKPIYIDSGVGSLYGRFSLKLRAEKPNPFYYPNGSDSDEQNQYLEIDNPNLRQRGLIDQFYKEYSYWIRNARIVKRPVHMELAQLLAIDKTKRVRVGDVMGFIRKIQYSVSNKTGLGEVTMEIMYI